MVDGFGTVLAIGAGGMLRGALEELSSGASRTIVVSRRASQANAKAPVPGRSVFTVDVDWNEPEVAMGHLENHLAAGVDLALLWVHTSADPFWTKLITRLVTQPCLVVQVLGSRAEPEEVRERVRALRPAAGFTFVTVALGSVLDGHVRRWLTDEEICAGVLRAVRDRRDVVVGDRGCA